MLATVRQGSARPPGACRCSSASDAGRANVQPSAPPAGCSGLRARRSRRSCATASRAGAGHLSGMKMRSGQPSPLPWSMARHAEGARSAYRPAQEWDRSSTSSHGPGLFTGQPRDDADALEAASAQPRTPRVASARVRHLPRADNSSGSSVAGTRSVTELAAARAGAGGCARRPPRSPQLAPRLVTVVVVLTASRSAVPSCAKCSSTTAKRTQRFA